MRTRILERVYHDLARSNGGKFLGLYTGLTADKVLWRCAKGHEWKANYGSIQQGKWCRTCGYEKVGNARRISESQYCDLAMEMGGKFVGFYTGKTTDKVDWQCGGGHVWRTTYSHVKGGEWCPVCAGKIQKTERDYHDLALKKNGKFLGPYTGRVYDAVGWICAKGHEWKTRYRSIAKGSWCPYCAGKARKTEKDYQDLANLMGGKFIGAYTGSTRDKVGWKCSVGHEWNAPYYSIDNGSWCPRCTNRVNGVMASKQQLEIAKMLEVPERHINYRVGRKFVDIALPEKHIAIEYDGWYWHKGNEHKDQKRVEYLVKLGWRVLTIRSRRNLPELGQIEKALDSLSEMDRVYLILDDWSVDGQI